MDILQNLDLLSVGIAIAGTGMLGFAVFYSNVNSVTNKAFLFFSMATVFWGILNYLSYQFNTPILVLWLFRLVMFFATIQAFSLYLLFKVFPESSYKFSLVFKYIYIPIVILTASICLSPFLFVGIDGEITDGNVASLIIGPGVIFFAIVNVGQVLLALIILLKKIISAKKENRPPLTLIFFGVLTMFSLIIYFKFILAGLMNNTRYIPLGALFVFPFILFTSYSIMRFRMFDVKVMLTVILVFLLSVVSFSEIILASELQLILFRSGVFTLVLVFGVMLVKSMIKLEKANQQKAEFMSFASHQIRTPVTIMNGYASNILEGDDGIVNDDVRNSLQKILIAGNNAMSLVSDYLDKSRIELGELKYHFKHSEISDLVGKVAVQMRPAIDQAKLVVILDIDRSKSYVANIDAIKFKQVIGNIVDNAIKYTPSGSIGISLTKKSGNIVIKISDTGVGISEEDINKLFQKFTRTNETNHETIYGTGLGLYLAKIMVEAHKGKIWAESKGIGEGSQFYIQIPEVIIKTN